MLVVVTDCIVSLDMALNRMVIAFWISIKSCSCCVNDRLAMYN